MIWRNTALFDRFLDLDNDVTDNKSLATIIVLGAYPINIDEFPNVKFVKASPRENPITGQHIEIIVQPNEEKNFQLQE